MNNTSDDEAEQSEAQTTGEEKGKALSLSASSLSASSLSANKLLQLPVSRIKTIMKSSPELGNVSPESYFLITQATELFVKYLAEQAHKTALDIDNTNKLVEYRQLAKLVSKDECLDFLEEIVPFKIKMSEYWKKYGHPIDKEKVAVKANGSSSHMKSPEAIRKTKMNVTPSPRSAVNSNKLNNSACNVPEVICID